MKIDKVIDQLESSVKKMIIDLDKAEKDSESRGEFAEWLNANGGDDDIDSAWQEFLKERE